MYKIYWKRKNGGKHWHTNKSVFTTKSRAKRSAQALRDKKTHYVQIRSIGCKHKHGDMIFYGR